MAKFLDKTGLDTFWTKIKSTFQTLGNLVTAWGSTPSDSKYPSEKLVKTSLDAKAPNAPSEVTIATGDKPLIADSSDGSKVKRANITFDTGVPTTYLCRNGTFNAVKEADVTWGGSFRAELSPAEFGNMARNIIHNPVTTAVTFEITTDGGTTWTAQSRTDAVIRALCSLAGGGAGSQFGLPNTLYSGVTDPTTIKGRLTIYAISSPSIEEPEDTWFYGIVKRVLVKISRAGDARMKVEYQTWPHFVGDKVWGDVGTFTVQGDSGWNSIPFDQTIGGYSGQLSSGRIIALRFTYWIESGTAPRIGVINIGFLPQIHWKSNAGNIPLLGVPITIHDDGTGRIEYANRFYTARKLKTNLARTADSTFDGSANQENIPVTGTLPIANGGTGATTAIGAEYNILNQVADIDTTVNGDRKIALCNQTKSASNGVFRWLKLSNVWTWIKGLLSSESGVNISGSSASCTGNAATATALASGGADRTKLDGIAAGAEVNVQSDWNQSTTTADDYIKNKPTLGTAAAKDVPSSGNASTTQVVMGNDSRLTDSRTPTSHTHGNITNAGGITASGVTIANGDALVIVDSSETNKLVAKTSVTFDGSTTTKALSQKGTFETFLTSHQSITGKMNTDASNAVAPSGNGGNGATATLLNNLTGPNNLDPITSDDVLIPTSISDGSDQTKWYKRPVSKLWSYIKGKMTSDSGVNISGTAATAKAFDSSFTGTNSIYSALNGKSSTSHTHVADANDVTDSSTGSDLSVVTDSTEFVTTNIGGYSSSDKKLYRRPFGTKVWPWIQSKLGSKGSNSSPIYLDNGVPKTMERSIILHDTRTGQDHLNPFFSARIDDTHFANLEAWDDVNSDLKVGIYGRNGTKAADFLCYKDANGDNYFNGLARGIYPFLINGVSNQNYAVFAKIVLDTSVAANTVASLRFRLTVLGTNTDSQNMAVSDLTFKLLPHESDFWSLCERIHRGDTDSTTQQPNSDVGRCIYWKSGATVYVGVYTGSFNARVGVEVVSVYGLGSSFTFDVGDFSSSVSGSGTATYNRTSAWADNNAGAGSTNLPVYARKDGKLETIGHQLQLPAATGGTGATEGYVRVGYGTANTAYLDATANKTGVWCKTNISGGDANGEWLCYRTPAGNNIFNGKANTAGDADTVDGYHISLGTIGTRTDTIYFG